MWSAGCVLYTMLSGYQPFYNESVSELIRQITNVEYSMEGEIWNQISEEGKNLIQCLITKDPIERLSPLEALDHEWLVDKKELDLASNNSIKYSENFKQTLSANMIHLIKSNNDWTKNMSSGDLGEVSQKDCLSNSSRKDFEVFSEGAPMDP